VRVRVAIAVLLLVALGACGSDDDGGGGGQIALDGTPRIPDAEGVVREVSRQRLVLDDGSTFTIGDELQSFSTYDASPAPILGRKGQYVQLGTDGNRVVWVAGIGVVVAGTPDVVYYTGHLDKIDGDRLVFRDGTVLRTSIARGDLERLLGDDVQAVLDPKTTLVTELAAT